MSGSRFEENGLKIYYETIVSGAGFNAYTKLDTEDVMES
jgi:hypothetical protein